MDLLEGFVLADKPRGLGSAALVGRLKYELKSRAAAAGRQAGGARKIKVGHTGTLDRFASGLMLLLTGRATALADQFLHADKAYVGRFQFGAYTDTHDPQGEIIESVTPAETRRFLESERERITRTVLALREATSQQPPLYSALKQDGRRFSDRARAGLNELPAERAIQVYALELRRYDLESGALDLDLHVSGGTYIRAFARDLSQELDFPVHLSELRRYRLGNHQLDGEFAAVAEPTAAIAADSRAARLTPAAGEPSAVIWRPQFFEAEPGRRAGQAGARADSSAEVHAPGPPARVRDLRLALPEWPCRSIPAGEIAAVRQGRFPSLQSLPGDPGTDFFIESLSGDEAARTASLLAWARVTGPGAYKYMRVFV